MFKTILVHVDADDPGSAGRLQCAAQLAREFQATLFGVSARLSPATVEMLASGGAAALAGGPLIDAPGELSAIFAAAKAQFDRCTAGSDLKTAWRTVRESPTPAITDLSVSVDLVVIGQAGTHLAFDGYNIIDVGELVMRAGKPVLVIPPGTTHLDLNNVVVAWKDTRASLKALANALPLLALAQAVTLVHVLEESDAKDSFAAARDFLEKNKIAATTEVVDAGNRAEGAALQAFATGALAGLVVAGAYGHNRLREWAFGGVTRDVLFSLPIPVLLSH